LKPRHYARPEDHKSEELKFDDLKEKCMMSAVVPFKQVRFGPVMHKVTNDQVYYYNFHVKEHYTFKIAFTGRRSVCPGFASLKEKPNTFKRIIRNKEV
jgi:hypothetical protein